MPRRKKRNNFNLILILLALAGGIWVAADYYFNVYRAPKKEVTVENTVIDAAAQNEKPKAKEESAPVLENGFKSEIYRDDRYGFEFQYPVTAVADGRCPKLEKTDDGFSLGAFSLVLGSGQGLLEDYMNQQLVGMEVEKKENIAVAGHPAIKVNYQTAGMGWYGSSVFVMDGNGKYFEFGLLANESGEKCGGVDDYEDQVYQSVIATLKFTGAVSR
ncbi:MAG: hypothetical protein WCX69_05860 [Candidatus Paceibacterota bacterium]